MKTGAGWCFDESPSIHRGFNCNFATLSWTMLVQIGPWAGPSVGSLLQLKVIYSRREARIDLCDFLLQNPTEFF